MATTQEHKDRVVEALRDAGGIAVWEDLIGLAAPEDEDDLEQLFEAGRHLHGTHLIVRGRVAHLLNPRE